MKKIIKLYSKYEELVNYLIVGLLTTIVSLGTYYSLRYFLFTSNSQLDIQVSNLMAFILAVLFSYNLNHHWVFKSVKKAEAKRKEFLSFAFSRILTLLLDILLMYILTVPLKINDKIAKLIVQVVITIANYIIGKYIIFKNKEAFY